MAFYQIADSYVQRVPGSKSAQKADQRDEHSADKDDSVKDDGADKDDSVKDDGVDDDEEPDEEQLDEDIDEVELLSAPVRVLPFCGPLQVPLGTGFHSKSFNITTA